MKESPRSFLSKLCPLAMSGLLVGSMSFAQDTNAIAKGEAARREAALPRGQEALGRAKAAMVEGNYTVAHEEFRLALNFLPDAVVSEKSHDDAVSGFCASGLKLAEQKIAEGKYGEAEAICRENPEQSLRSELPPGGGDAGAVTGSGKRQPHDGPEISLEG